LAAFFYIASFGPACRICDEGWVSGQTLWWIYRPIAIVYCYLPVQTRNGFTSFLDEFRVPKNGFIETPEPLGREWEYQGLSKPNSVNAPAETSDATLD
jgi:hypothetical protein